MSAWMVSKQHIDAMVTVYLGLQDTRYASFNHIDPQKCGQTLVTQNVRSLEARYGKGDDIIPAWAYRPYQYRPSVQPFSLAQALQNIACYEYQACETEDWQRTSAFYLCQSMTFLIARAAVGAEAYDGTRWGWDAS